MTLDFNEVSPHLWVKTTDRGMQESTWLSLNASFSPLGIEMFSCSVLVLVHLCLKTEHI